MDIQEIKEIALANGFSLKEQASGNMDLHSYVYEFANAIEQAAKAQAVPEGFVLVPANEVTNNKLALEYKDLYRNAFNFKVIGLHIDGQLFNIMFSFDAASTDLPFVSENDGIFITNISVGHCLKGNTEDWTRTDEAKRLQGNKQLCMRIGYQLLDQLMLEKKRKEAIEAKEQSNA